ncbi:MAG: hypothetical protein KF744_02445 [Taibaiella sp.]|nr:hypothetical protein [Taibaiella sp.]
MNAKLTLSLDENVIKRAKRFAENNHTSLSQVVESYLSELTKKEKETDGNKISPLVQSLMGVLDLPADFDFKKDRTAYLKSKYK